VSTGLSKSSSSSNTSSTTIAPNITGQNDLSLAGTASDHSNQSAVAAGGVNLQAGGDLRHVTVNSTTTDFGAIGKALEFGSNALQANSAALGQAFAQSQSVIDKTPVGDSATLTRMLTIGGAIAVGLVFVVVLGKKG
jgi:hypothetical protein